MPKAFEVPPGLLFPTSARTPRPPTMEEVGLTQGSSLVATPEQAAELEAAERALLDARIAEFDHSFGRLTGCVVCGAPGTIGPTRTCDACQAVARSLDVEQAAKEKVGPGGRTRRQLVAEYQARQRVTDVGEAS